MKAREGGEGGDEEEEKRRREKLNFGEKRKEENGKEK
jgi:hypothetical protein